MRLLPLCILALLLTHCAFGEYGQRINAEQHALADLEDKRQKLETRYIIVLNNLEANPTEAELQLEKDKIYRRIQAITEEIGESRKMLDQSFSEWDKKILEERIQQQMIDKEVHDAAGVIVPDE